MAAMRQVVGRAGMVARNGWHPSVGLRRAAILAFSPYGSRAVADAQD